MIEFEHKLPCMYVDGNQNGTYNNTELGFPSILTTKDTRLGVFIDTLRGSILKERSLVFIDGKILMCDKNWIRDHVHTMKAFRHWEYNLDSFLNFIIETQREDGQFYELIKQDGDCHWEMVDENCRVFYENDNLWLIRLELEADIEYLVVEGAMYLYKTTGDNVWLEKVLPYLEKSIDYITSDSKRWDKEHGLVKRPFTIDTWDFAYNTSPLDRKINDDSPMSIMHGDNSGVYQAMVQLAWFNRRLGREEKALDWERRAGEIRDNMFKYLWNGNFFIHQLHLNHKGADELENIRLSLSNSYNINRGVTTTMESKKIIDSYIQRGKEREYFAEWFTIDPPYEEFVGRKAGSYVNGAISPFTAGELAKGAFNNGCEEYGWTIIQRFIELVERDGATYFLYYPDSKPQPDGGPSAWGAAALISAVDEGLAGIVDAGTNYDEIDFSPRFPVTGYKELRYITGYEVNGTMIDVRYIIKDEGMRYDIHTTILSEEVKVNAHIYIPENKKVSKVLVNDQEVNFEAVFVLDSLYADFKICQNSKETIKIEVLFD